MTPTVASWLGVASGTSTTPGSAEISSARSSMRPTGSVLVTIGVVSSSMPL